MKLARFRRSIILFAFILHTSCFLLPSSASSQFLHSHEIPPHIQPRNSLIASYALIDAPLQLQDTVPMTFAAPDAANAPGHKSGFLAAALSLAVPGLGEYYVGDHIWRGMIFTGIEAGLWVGMVHWQQQYNNDQNAFYSFSGAHFCVSRYGGYMDTILVADSVTPYAHASNCDWQQVSRTDWNSINQAEAEMDSLSNSHSDLGDWNHRLINPNDDMQQYYEMVSKYFQYLPGWDNLSNFNTASSMRAEAQHQADIANDFLFGIILNHVLSAIDAALLARDHNSTITLHGDLIEQPYPDGTMGFIPTANIEYQF